MCTLAVAFLTDRRWPVAVAANRDERLGRASEPWGIREPAAGRRHAAPRDLEAGGTWIGVSAGGVFAAVTNFHTGTPHDRSRRSRGDLVPLALACADAAAARAALAPLDARAWNPFHLVVADAREAFLWRWDGASAALDPLEPGLHVVTERSFDGRDPRGEAVRARWPLDLAPARLGELLASHGPSAEVAACIHRDPVYGTRSATVLRLAPSLAASELYASDGPPCRTPLDDRSSLLAALAGRA
jgi:uncharacterized protein with NRDE domain